MHGNLRPPEPRQSFPVFSELVVCRLSSVCNVRALYSGSQAIEIFGSILRHLVRWTSIDCEVKFYGDRPRGTPPLGC